MFGGHFIEKKIEWISPWGLSYHYASAEANTDSLVLLFDEHKSALHNIVVAVGKYKGSNAGNPQT